MLSLPLVVVANATKGKLKAGDEQNIDSETSSE